MKILALIALALIFALVVAVFGTVFVYLGWNYGVVAAFPSTHEIGLSSAFWLSVFVSIVGGMFKSEVKSS